MLSVREKRFDMHENDEDAQRESALREQAKVLNAQESRRGSHIAGTLEAMCWDADCIKRLLSRAVDVLETDPDTGVPDKTRMVKDYKKNTASSEGLNLFSSIELRTPDWIKITLDYLTDDVLGNTRVDFAHTYAYLRDRMRSLRQDLSCQGITSPLTVEVTEKSARLIILAMHKLRGTKAFDKQDLELLSKCLTTLKHSYKAMKTKALRDGARAEDVAKMFPNEAEFYAYIVLHVPSSSVLSEVPPEHVASSHVTLAFKVVGALSRRDYSAFFRLVRAAPFSFASLMLLHFWKAWGHAFSVLFASKQPSASTKDRFPMPKSWLIRELLLEDENHMLEIAEAFGLVGIDGQLDLYSRVQEMHEEEVAQRPCSAIETKICGREFRDIVVNGDSAEDVRQALQWFQQPGRSFEEDTEALGGEYCSAVSPTRADATPMEPPQRSPAPSPTRTSEKSDAPPAVAPPPKLQPLFSGGADFIAEEVPSGPLGVRLKRPPLFVDATRQRPLPELPLPGTNPPLFGAPSFAPPVSVPPAAETLPSFAIPEAPRPQAKTEQQKPFVPAFSLAPQAAPVQQQQQPEPAEVPRAQPSLFAGTLFGPAPAFRFGATSDIAPSPTMVPPRTQTPPVAKAPPSAAPAFSLPFPFRPQPPPPPPPPQPQSQLPPTPVAAVLENPPEPASIAEKMPAAQSPKRETTPALEEEPRTEEEKDEPEPESKMEETESEPQDAEAEEQMEEAESEAEEQKQLKEVAESEAEESEMEEGEEVVEEHVTPLDLSSVVLPTLSQRFQRRRTRLFHWKAALFLPQDTQRFPYARSLSGKLSFCPSGQGAAPTVDVLSLFTATDTDLPKGLRCCVCRFTDFSQLSDDPAVQAELYATQSLIFCVPTDHAEAGTWKTELVAVLSSASKLTVPEAPLLVLHASLLSPSERSFIEDTAEHFLLPFKILSIPTDDEDEDGDGDGEYQLRLGRVLGGGVTWLCDNVPAEPLLARAHLGELLHNRLGKFFVSPQDEAVSAALAEDGPELLRVMIGELFELVVGEIADSSLSETRWPPLQFAFGEKDPASPDLDWNSASTLDALRRLVLALVPPPFPFRFVLTRTGNALLVPRGGADHSSSGVLADFTELTRVLVEYVRSFRPRVEPSTEAVLLDKLSFMLRDAFSSAGHTGRLDVPWHAVFAEIAHARVSSLGQAAAHVLHYFPLGPRHYFQLERSTLDRSREQLQASSEMPSAPLPSRIIVPDRKSSIASPAASSVSAKRIAKRKSIGTSKRVAKEQSPATPTPPANPLLSSELALLRAAIAKTSSEWSQQDMF